MATERVAFFMENYAAPQASFGPASNTVLGMGGGNMVANGMEQPGGITPMQSQVSPASAIYQPGLQAAPPPQVQMPSGSPMSQFSMQASMNPQMPQQQPQAQPQQPNAPQPKAESHSIIEALTTRLKDIAKLENSLYGIQ